MNFNDRAAKWDDPKRVKRAQTISEQIKNYIDIKENYKALEFGCGTGLISFNLKDEFNSIDLVDTSKGMIEVLNSKIEENNIRNMRAFELDINKEYKLENESYDIIYSSMVMHHVTNLKEILKNLYKLLKEGGCICIVDLDKDDGSFHEEEDGFNGHNGFNQEEFSNLLSEIGFDNINSKTFYHGEKELSNKIVKYSLFIMLGFKSN
ncbi:class I SAM-dependent methyltransferase [Clostridium sp. YIM B02515]|uniref:Class I SAM-dependent methyltransferase n=1 Tax=Clostridium rhizosphaerae TaxID=2803861 RepID=A0ABS1TD39_9CLOT|nr:class I SAM-dependent methyltransferase [Clostridium rhizosphaerae]MBL4937250.1 class I SAM-dependent methyltransferase [Clostridium rhizosphaerae]